MHIHRSKTRLLGAVLALLAISAVAGAAQEAAALPGGRRLLSERRSLLQSCDVCPSTSVATAACQAVPQSQVSSIRADLISRCSNVGINPARCCELYSSSNWPAYSGCACSNVIPGLNAFVDGAAVMSACGCGGTASTGAAAAGPAPTLSISEIYSAVSFSSGGRSAPSTVSAVTTPGNATGAGGGTGSVVTYNPSSGGGGSGPPAGGGGGGETPPATPPSP